MRQSSTGKRILLNTFGSFGDLHPYIAIALELKARGHQPVIATSAYYREKVEAEGLSFHPLRPDLPPVEEAPEALRKTLNGRAGAKYLFSDILMPHLRETYTDLQQAADGVDVIVTHPLSYAGQVLAEKVQVSWVSTVLAPASLFSAYDPPMLDIKPNFTKLLRLHSTITRFAFGAAKLSVRAWVEPVQRLRRELGLAPSANPMFEGQHSPTLVLALFSREFARPQPDWPRQTRLTGFPFYDRLGRTGATTLAPELQRFLDAGPPPIVFTLGSTAVWIADDFYRESIDAAVRLNTRAVLLIGDRRNLPPSNLPPNVAAFDYAPYSEIFPRASVIVHSGGIGTTAQAMRAGVPVLIVPFSFDQPDNAARITRLGLGRMLPRRYYTAARAADELKRLLSEPGYAKRAAEVGQRVRQENGAGAACDAIEQIADFGLQSVD